MQITTRLRQLADEVTLARPVRAELLTALGDLADELVNLVDALTELDEAGSPGDRVDARELVTGRADDVLGELAACGLIAPRLGTGQHTGRELTLNRLARLGHTTYAGSRLKIDGYDRQALDLVVEAVLVDTGYLPAAR